MKILYISQYYPPEMGAPRHGFPSFRASGSSGDIK